MTLFDPSKTRIIPITVTLSLMMIIFVGCEEKPKPNPLQKQLDQARFDVVRITKERDQAQEQLKAEMLRNPVITDEEINARMDEMQLTIKSQRELNNTRLRELQKANDRIANLETQLANLSNTTPDDTNTNTNNHLQITEITRDLQLARNNLNTLNQTHQQLKNEHAALIKRYNTLIADSSNTNTDPIPDPPEDNTANVDPVYLNPGVTRLHINDFLNALKRSDITGYENVTWGQSLSIHFNERQWYVHATKDNKYTLEFQGRADQSFTAQFPKLELPPGTIVTFSWNCDPESQSVDLKRIRMGETDIVGDLTPLYKALAHIY